MDIVIINGVYTSKEDTWVCERDVGYHDKIMQ